MMWVIVLVATFFVVVGVAGAGLMFLHGEGSVTTTVIALGVTLVLGVLGVVLTPMAGWYVVDGLRSEGWSTTDGVIEESRIEVTRRRTSRGTRTDRVLRLRFGFDVGGRHYTGDDLAMSADQGYVGVTFSSNESRMEAMVAEHPKGAHVTVWYDPSRPSSSVLTPGVRSTEAGRLGLGLAGLLVAMASGVALITSPNVRRLLEE